MKRVETTQNEVQLLASLNHPNIISFYDAVPFYKKGSHKINLSLIMEYVSRGGPF